MNYLILAHETANYPMKPINSNSYKIIHETDVNLNVQLIMQLGFADAFLGIIPMILKGDNKKNDPHPDQICPFIDHSPGNF